MRFIVKAKDFHLAFEFQWRVVNNSKVCNYSAVSPEALELWVLTGSVMFNSGPQSRPWSKDMQTYLREADRMQACCGMPCLNSACVPQSVIRMSLSRSCSTLESWWGTQCQMNICVRKSAHRTWHTGGKWRNCCRLDVCVRASHFNIGVNQETHLFPINQKIWNNCLLQFAEWLHSGHQQLSYVHSNRKRNGANVNARWPPAWSVNLQIIWLQFQVFAVSKAVFFSGERNARGFRTFALFSRQHVNNHHQRNPCLCSARTRANSSSTDSLLCREDSLTLHHILTETLRTRTKAHVSS